MLKKFLIILTFFVVTFCVGGGYIWYQLDRLSQQEIHTTEDQLLVIEKGTGSSKLASLLQQQGIIENTALLPYLLKLNPQWTKYKAGVYSLNGIHNVQALLELLNSGKEVQLTLQFIEGKTWASGLKQLENARYLNHLLQGQSEAEIAQQLGIERKKLEGWFAPDTYHYVPYSSDVDVLKRAYAQQQKTLDQAWKNRAENLPLASPYELLILASIVEKETSIASERAKVASVFINRLRLKMKLQTDPTVIYGMGERYQGNIRKADLLEATAYNTYVIDGLPPTPIAMPSSAAIQASANPDETPYLYFVADGSGGHKFSRSLQEHNQAVENWKKIERERKNEQKSR